MDVLSSMCNVGGKVETHGSINSGQDRQKVGPCSLKVAYIINTL